LRFKKTRTTDKTASSLQSAFKCTERAGVSQSILGKIIGKDRTSIHRGIEPSSKSGELALLFIRCYRGLYVLIGGKACDMKHWMHTENRHTGGVPAEQIQTVQGLNHVLEYLDAMRGKI